MSLIYSFVARGTVVLAEYTKYTGNFSNVAIECLSRLSSNSQNRFTYTTDAHLLNFVMENGYTYLLVSEKACPRETAFYFLDEVRKEFEEKFGDKGKQAIAHSLDRQFGPRLKYHMEYVENNPTEISKIARVKAQVDQVKGIMVDNIEKVLERGEKIDLLVDKTENLRDQANKFHRAGRQLRSKMWWQNMKMKLIVLAVIILLAFVLFCVICFSGGNCLKK